MAAAAPIITVLTSSTVTGMIARFALSVAVSFIANKLFAPDVPSGPGQMEQSPDQGVRQRIASNPGNKLPILYGNTRVFGSITFADITSDNQTMAFIISLCEGPIENIGQIWWDDFRLTLDSDGNVKKDSLGNDIKTPKKIEIVANIFVTNMEKTGNVQYSIDIYNGRNQLISSNPFTEVTRFTHQYW